MSRVGKVGWTLRPPLAPPPSLSSSLSTGRLFPPPPCSPPTCSSLRGQGSPPPLRRRAGGSGINPPPNRTSPPPPPPPGSSGLDFVPGRAGGRGPSRPLPVHPVGIRPRAGTGEGEGGRAPLFKLVSFPRRRLRLRSCVRVCAPTGPPTPPPLCWWGRLLKGSEPGSGALGRRLGVGTEEGGWGRGAECCRVSHVRPTYYSPAPTGSRDAGLWGLQETTLAPRSGPRRSNNPASSSFPARGLPLVGPAGLLPPTLSWGRAACGFPG